jgi:peptidyl-prolyl cis-trans isomerase B (cyclophilin B)
VAARQATDREDDQVSPNRREREYARRRYQKWQLRQIARQAKRRRLRRTSAVAAAAVATVAVILGAIWLLTGKGSGTSSAAQSTPKATATASASQAADNPCPAPSVTPPAKPKTFASAPAASTAGKTWNLTLDTSCGGVLIQMDGTKAPHAVAAMLLLARNGYFDGSPCHRLTTAGIYVLQCGDPTGTGTGGPGFEYGPVENAPKNNVYPAGTVAMARRGGNAKSIGSQFFLVYKDSTIPSDAAGGYTVIGKVVGGEDVVEKVAAGGVAGGGQDGKPERAISIVSTSVAPG